MKMNTSLVITVTAHLSAEELPFPLIPYEPDGKDRGYLIAVSMITVDYSVQDGIFPVTARVRGVRVDRTAEGPVYGTAQRRLELDVAALPSELITEIREMTAKAAADWKTLTGGA